MVSKSYGAASFAPSITAAANTGCRLLPAADPAHVQRPQFVQLRGLGAWFGFGFGFYTARDPLVAPAPPGERASFEDVI